MLLIDTEFQRREGNLLLQVNRNGLCYILDRIKGEDLLSEPFVDAATGDTLWRFEANRIGEGPPMT